MTNSEEHKKLHEVIYASHEVSEGIFKNLNATDIALLDCIQVLEKRIEEVEKYIQCVKGVN